MLLEKWDPFREFDDLHREVNRVFHALAPRSRDEVAVERGVTWRPVSDASEDVTGVTLRVELPGVDKDGIDVKIENGVLTIAGEKKAEAREEGTEWHRVEAWYGAFRRSFALPDYLDPEKVEASFRNGVLTLHVARRQEALPRKVDVTIA